jgi:hypothetical protein
MRSDISEETLNVDDTFQPTPPVKGSGFVQRATGHALTTIHDGTPSKTTKPLSFRFEPRVTHLNQQPSGDDGNNQYNKTSISR